MIRANDMGSVFALARYAAEKAKPLVDRIPGGCLCVEVSADDKWQSEPWHVHINVHRVVSTGTRRDLAPMVVRETALVDSVAVDAAVDELRRIVEAQAWDLHPLEKVAA